jgi:PAS fold
MPSIDILDVDNLKRIAEKLMLCHVIKKDNDLRFLIKSNGKQFELAHGKRCVGRFVDETIAPSLREKAISMYRRVVATREPFFSSTPMREGDGPIVYYERLLLPFTKTGLAVEYICCVIKMISEENGVNFDIAVKGPAYFGNCMIRPSADVA